LIWREITGKSLKATIQLFHIEELARTLPEVSQFLRLDILMSSKNVKHARTEFINDPIRLDDKVGIAIAKILLLFGISLASHKDVITSGVCHLLQGWAVEIPRDEHEPVQQSYRSFLRIFTNTAINDSRAVSHPNMERDLRDAFEKGVEQAATILLEDSPKRCNKRVRHNKKRSIKRNQNT
jgi:hypothetical protein